MRGSKPIGLMTLVIAVLVVTAAGLYFSRGPGKPVARSEPEAQRLSGPETSSGAIPPSATDQGSPSAAAPVRPSAEGPSKTADARAASPAPPTSPPSFDVARIEPDGNGVMAGRAEPNWTVIVENGGATVAETKADDEGAWAIVLDTPLAPGNYRLSLRETSPDGAQSLSAPQTVEVAIAESKTAPAVAALNEPAEPRLAETNSAPAATEKAEGPSAPATSPEAAAPSVPQTPSAGASSPGAAERQTRRERAAIREAASAAAAVPEAPPTASKSVNDLPIVPLPANRAAPGQTVAAEGEGHEAEVKAGKGSDTNASPAPTPKLVSPPAVLPAPVGKASPEPAPARLASTSSVPQATPPPSPEVPKVSHPKSYSVQRGDTLWDIAESYLGGGWHYRQIARSNRGSVHNPNRIYPDQTLDLPKE